MHSQEASARLPAPATRRAGLVLLVLAWLLGLTLALQHRFGHAAEVGHGHDEPHLAGGPHSGDDGGCRLVDQAGLGEALPSAAAVLAAPDAASPRALRPPAPRPVAAAWRAYEARGPPRG